MNLSTVLVTGFLFGTLLIAVSICNYAFASTQANQKNSKDMSKSGGLIGILTAAKNNTGQALGSLEGGAQCGFECIRVAAQKLNLVNDELKMALSILNNTS
jgi:hypothetical protein